MNVRKPKYVAWLVAPGAGIIQGCGFADRHAAGVALEDRRANGEAFPGERVARVPVRLIDPWGRNRLCFADDGYRTWRAA